MSLYIRGVNLPERGSVLTIRSDGKVEMWAPGDLAFCGYGRQEAKAYARQLHSHGDLVDKDEYKVLLPTIENEYKFARKLLDEILPVIAAEEDVS